MGLFDFGKKEIKKLTAQVQALQSFSLRQANINSTIAIYPEWDLSEQANRYSSTDDVYSIITRLAKTAALIPIYGYIQTQDQKAFTRLKREQKGYQNPRRYKDLQTKALEDLPENDPVAMLLENPCEDKSKFEFLEAVFSFLLISGNCYILKERPDFGANAGKPIQLHILFPQNVVPKISESLPRKIIAYDYRINGVTIQENIPASDIIHIKYFNPNMTLMGGELTGMSPLQVLKQRLTRLDSEMNVSVAQLQNGGVPGIVYDKGPDQAYDSSGKEVSVIGSRKKDFYDYLSAKNNKGAPYFASGEMAYIQLGMNLADLSVAELANVDFKKLCNVFGVSDILFNSDSASTESNVLIMTKSLYTNTVLPNVFRVRDALIKGLLPDFRDGVVLTGEDGEPIRIAGDGKNRFIDVDISDISELNEDMAQVVTALAAAYWLTPNEKREVMNWERYENPLFDEPLLPLGLQTIEEMATIEPIDTTPTDGNFGNGQ